ncbi:radical SAM/SPASM domain-containing protein [Effusibacillus lacus]|uniref:Heme b synthase n=1 Tax=Effusibacillus lacus TaxID=1348429 RepID=A0A292YRH9_9BACL|nr:radical SAM protein [Effusibacillus lacus]TCS76116.1 heme b synthase [Effusibacillus lacus]GAX91373.1 heme b synthase [Effusibacillus lacus]
MIHHTNEANHSYVPRLIFWELTEGCNLKCIHCRASAQPERSRDELSTDEVFQIIDQISEVAKPILILTGGEPLYRPDIFGIARYAADKGMHVALASNGTLIDKWTASRIRMAGIKRVSISLDGASETIHDSFRGIPGSFHAALRGARHLQEEGVPVQFNTTITKHNEHELEQLFELAREKKAVALHLFMLVPVGCGVQIADDQLLSAERYEEILTWFYDKSQAVNYEIKATCAPHYYRIMRQQAKRKGLRVTRQSHGMSAVTKGCLAGTGVCFISHKGMVQPCGYLPLSAGNLKKQNFRDIWDNSPLFRQLRSVEQLKGKCGICEYVNVCSGCRARAFSHTGNIMEAEPYCTYHPTRRSSL